MQVDAPRGCFAPDGRMRRRALGRVTAAARPDRVLSALRVPHTMGRKRNTSAALIVAWRLPKLIERDRVGAGVPGRGAFRGGRRRPHPERGRNAWLGGFGRRDRPPGLSLDVAPSPTAVGRLLLPCVPSMNRRDGRKRHDSPLARYAIGVLAHCGGTRR